MTKSTNLFKRSGKHDRKLALLRRADTERDSKGFSISGAVKKGRLAGNRKVSLAPVPSLEKPDGDDVVTSQNCGGE